MLSHKLVLDRAFIRHILGGYYYNYSSVFCLKIGTLKTVFAIPMILFY